MGDGPIEPVIDPISPDGEIARVHLQAFVLRGGSIEELVEAFIRSANEYHGNINLLEHYWKLAANLGFFSAAGMENFIQTMKAKDYPATHHSPEYTGAYHPTYRVILPKYCNAAIAGFLF